MNSPVAQEPHPLAPPAPPTPPHAAGPGPGPEAEDVVRSLYDAHGKALLSFALRLTKGDRLAAEDAVQETLLRAWRNSDQLRAHAGSSRPWLFTVLRRFVIDQHRRASVRPVEVAPGTFDLVAEHNEIDRRLSALWVEDALGQLSPAHRQVVVELYYRGSSVAEAASALGVPEGTVKSRAYYALRALRIALEERGATA